jgi:DNA-binding NarL/FixJ family response regulator
MTTGISIRVFLLSGSRFLGEALARVLRKTADILVVGTRPYSVDAPSEIIESACDVLLMDTVSGLALDSQVLDNLRCSLSNLKVIMIELDDNEATFSKVAQMGIAGYLLKEVAVDDVMSAIRAVAKGEGVSLHAAR